jgi:hypothetical protein
MGCTVIKILDAKSILSEESKEPFPPFAKSGSATMDGGRDLPVVCDELDPLSNFWLMGDRLSCVLKDLEDWDMRGCHY